VLPARRSIASHSLLWKHRRALVRSGRGPTRPNGRWSVA